MATERINRSNDFKSLQTLYYALALGQILMMFIFCYLTINDATIFGWEMSNPIHLVAPILMMSCIAVGSFLFTKKMEEANRIKGLQEKLLHYRSSIIMRSALLEGANLICIVLFLLESNYFFLMLFFIGFAAFFLVRPSEDFFREKYKLNENERLEFRKMLKM